MPIDRKTRREIIDRITPYLTPGERETRVRGAFWGDSILERIAWDGDAVSFSVALVNTLLTAGSLDDGDDPLVVLLDEMRLHAPPDDRAVFGDLLARIKRDNVGDTATMLSIPRTLTATDEIRVTPGPLPDYFALAS
ncbi:MAG: hypothetical protein AAF125_05775, partial [Chloroflexota bacterium]